MYFNDEEIVEYIPNAEEMKKRVCPLYIINDYIQTPETFEKFSNDKWNWFKWSMTSHFNLRFWEYISNGVIIRNLH